MKHNTIHALERSAAHFKACDTINHVAELIAVSPLQLVSLSINPQYLTFEVPKKNGSMRLIENPVPHLKAAQKQLNEYLQAVYYVHRTDAAYGFVVSPSDDPNRRNIKTNAELHLGKPWLLNADLRDFFHWVKEKHVREVFKSDLFGLDTEAASILTGLTCYNGRLPMGAPTSPVLSNLAFRGMDRDLAALAEKYNLVYSRYADDMSFSSDKPIDDVIMSALTSIVQKHQFSLHPDKVKLYGPDDPNKQVTGLLVTGETVGLPDDYVENLEQVVQQFATVNQVYQKFPDARMYSKPEWLEELQLRIEGKIAFAEDILGKQNDIVQTAKTSMEAALAHNTDFGPIEWLEFGYAFHK